MSATALDTTLRELEARLAHPPVAGSLGEGELQGLPDPVCRYLRASIAAGTPLARSARLGMHGAVKLGRWWIPFRARQVYAPHHGLVWTARAGGVIAGFDRYADGQGAMQWKLLGLIRLLHAQGPDLSRSAAGRAAAEAVWVPTALLPRFGVTGEAADAHHLTASWRLDDLQPTTVSPSAISSTSSMWTSGKLARNGAIQRLAAPASSGAYSSSTTSRWPPLNTSSTSRRTTVLLASVIVVLPADAVGSSCCGVRT